MSLEDDILIEEYLRGTLSEHDRVLFLNRISEDIQFREEYLIEKQLYEILNNEDWSFGNHPSEDVDTFKKLFEGNESKEFSKIFQNAETIYLRNLKRRKLFKRICYTSAAILIFALGIYSFLDNSIDSEQLYAAYINKKNLPSLIVRGGNSDNLVEAQFFFEEEDYTKALEIFSNELKRNATQDANIYIYVGISQMELNKFQKAQETFEELLSSDLIDASKANWYFALLYVKKGEIENAKRYLNEIVTSNSYNNQLAKELLNDLD